MNTKTLAFVVAFLGLSIRLVQAAALGTGFTYQGHLQDGTNAANGAYDFQFNIFDAATLGTQVGGTLTNPAVPVSNGVFTVTLDFGSGVFDGRALWLETALRTNGTGAFSALPPRVSLTATPYALLALQAGSASTVAGAAVSAPGLNTPKAPAPGQLLSYDGNSLAWTDLGVSVAPAWLLGGNAGTAPGTHFLGTTDNQPLELKVNGQRAMRLEPGVNGLPNLLGGASVNTVEAGVFGATIGGGGEPAWPNRISADFGTVAGGEGNQLGPRADGSTIGGGTLNAVGQLSANSVIAGGHGNMVEPSAFYGTIGGGQNNTNGYLSVGAMIPGGRENYAGGMMSFAAGTRAKAISDGTFVWADYTEADFVSTAKDQFLIRANGGVGINTNRPQAALHVVGTVQADRFVGSGAGLTPGSVSATALAPGAASQLGTPDGSNLQALQVVNNGAVGIGTTNPLAGLDVASTYRSPALMVLSEIVNGSSGFTNLGWANCVAAQGQLVAVGAARPGAVSLMDVSHTQPDLKAVVYNGMLLRVLDPSQPSVRLSLGGVTGVALGGDLLVVAAPADNAVALFTVSDPASPAVASMMKDGAGGFDYLGGANAVALSGNLLAIAAVTDNAVTLVDTSDPASVHPAAVLRQGEGGYAHLLQPSCVALSGSLMAVGSFGTNAVTLVNVAVPGDPVKLAELVQGVGGFDKLRGITSVALNANLLAIADQGDGAVTLVDVSQPQSPQLKAVLQEGIGGLTTLAGARSVAMRGNLLAVGAGVDNAVTLFDISDPARPQLLSQARQGVAGAHYLDGVAGLAFADDSLAVTATDDSAVTVLSTRPQAMGLVAQGWVGVGTEHPVAPLDVVGSVVVENAPLFNVNAVRVELGEDNRAGGTDALAAGRESVSTGYGSVAAGYGANAGGRAAVALGDHTSAAADGSMAAGAGAQALHPGSFVWADSTAGAFSSSANNQFLIRAAGGVGINRTNPAATLDVNGQVAAGGFLGSGAALTNLDPGAFSHSLRFSPGTPRLLGAIKATGMAVAIRDRYCYVAAGVEGLKVYDVRDPASPVLIRQINDGGQASDVVLAGHYCYLANYTDGLRIYDISDPANPVGVGHNSQLSNSLHLAISGGLCSVLDGINGLRVLDVSNPAAPKIAGSIAGGGGNSIVVSGRYCYVSGNGLQIYDVSNPAQPVKLGGIQDPGFALDLAVVGRYCYLANDSDGIRVYDVLDPAHPVGVWHESFILRAVALTMADNRCYVAASDGNLLVLDVTDPAHPRPLDGIGGLSQQNPIRIACAPGYCYLARGSAGVEIIAVGQVTLDGSVAALRFEGDGSGLTNLDATALTGIWNLRNSDLYLGWTYEGGLGWYGGSKTFDGLAPNGPVLYGKEGGVLGTDSPAGGSEAALTWNASGALAVDPKDRNQGALVPGLTFGKSSGEGIASKRFEGDDQYGLDFYTSFKPRLTIANDGKIGVGTITPNDALLDVEGNVRINDNDLFLRGEADRNHGLGWYGGTRTFGDAAPDGPVLYGHGGGVLATTGGGRQQSALTWDNGGVAITKDLSVGGSLNINGRAFDGGVPFVRYSPDFDKVIHVQAAETGAGTFFGFSSCTVPRPGPGVYVIVATVHVFDSSHSSILLLEGAADPNKHDLPCLGYACLEDRDVGIVSSISTTLSLNAVHPVTNAGPDLVIGLYGYSDTDTDMSLLHFAVMFFPGQPNGTGAAAQISSARSGGASSTGAPAFLRRSAGRTTEPKADASQRIRRTQRLSPLIEEALAEKDARISELERNIAALAAQVKGLARNRSLNTAN